MESGTVLPSRRTETVRFEISADAFSRFSPDSPERVGAAPAAANADPKRQSKKKGRDLPALRGVSPDLSAYAA
jgi:hypothetical protein